MRRAVATAALPFALAFTLAAPADAKPKRPKPDQPLTVFVYTNASSAGDAKSLKEMGDSAGDVTDALRKKKDWFTVAENRGDAEVLVEIRSRSYQGTTAYVLEGRVTVLNLISDARIIGQGGLDRQQMFNIWRTAANDLASRLQTFCEGMFADVEIARKEGMRPAAIAATDRGDALAKSGDVAGAEAAYAEAIRISPRYARAYFNRGVLRHDRDQADEAAADYDAAIAIDPSVWTAHFNRALLAHKRGELDAALAGFGEAIRLQPQESSSYLRRGLVHSRRKDRAAAMADFAKAIQLAPADASAYFERGVLHADANAHDAAIADFGEAIRLRPQDAAGHYWRGRMYALAKRDAEAMVDLDRALALEPKMAQAFFERANVRARLGRTDLALADYDRSIALDPKEPAAWFNRGLVHFKKGALKMAEADRREAGRLDPSMAKEKYR